MRLLRCIQVSFWPLTVSLSARAALVSGSKTEPPLAAGTAEAGRDSWTSCRATVSGGRRTDNVDCRSSQFSRPFRLRDTASPLAHSHWPGAWYRREKWMTGSKKINKNRMDSKLQHVVRLQIYSKSNFNPSLAMQTGFQCYGESPLLTFMSLAISLRLRQVRTFVICDFSSSGIWLNLNSNLIYS